MSQDDDLSALELHARIEELAEHIKTLNKRIDALEKNQRIEEKCDHIIKLIDPQGVAINDN